MAEGSVQEVQLTLQYIYSYFGGTLGAIGIPEALEMMSYPTLEKFCGMLRI